MSLTVTAANSLRVFVTALVLVPRVGATTPTTCCRAPCSTICPTAPMQDGGEIEQRLDEAAAALPRSFDGASSRAEARYWVDAIRAAVARDPTATQVPIALMRVGEILEQIGAFEEALSEYSRVSGSLPGSGWHMSALLRSVRAAAALDDDPHRAIAFLDAFEFECDAAARNGSDVWPQHLRSFTNRLMTRANIYASAAQRLMSNPGGHSDVQTAAFYLLHAGNLLESWLWSRAAEEDLGVLASERIRTASYFVEAGSLLARSRNNASRNPTADIAFATASSLLEHALADPWSGVQQHYAATLQLKNLFAIHGATDGYLGEARRVLDAAVVGHEALSFLRDLGNILARRPEVLRIADAVFQLVVDTESKWFPDEFGLHVNYQWSRIEQGRAALALGDVERAHSIANELDTLPIEGEVLQRLRDHVRKSVDRRSAVASAPTFDSIEHGGAESIDANGAREIESLDESAGSNGIPADPPSRVAQSSAAAVEPITNAGLDGLTSATSLASERLEAPRTWSSARCAVVAAACALGAVVFVRIRRGLR